MIRFLPRLFSVFLVLAVPAVYFAQPPRMLAYEYIDRYRDIAVVQAEAHGIPASVILAQAIFESGCGRSDLAQRSNNHFGIKCHTTWEGDTVNKSDDALNECFRKYETIEASYRDHSRFLSSRPWYKPLFDLARTDYKGWCYGLKEAGYATYATYAEELIRIIEQNQLYLLDAPERLSPRLVVRHREELRDSKTTAHGMSLSRFAQCDLLFSDASDFVLRSLRLVPDGQAPYGMLGIR